MLGSDSFGEYPFCPCLDFCGQALSFLSPLWYPRHQKAEAERTINETKQRYQDAVAAFNEAKRELIQLQKDAEESAPLHDENGEELPLKAQLEDLAMETPEETQAALEEAQHTANSIVADRNVVRQYEARQREMEEVQAELDSVNGSKEKRKTELLMKFKPWEQSLEESVAKVDALFSRYMRELGCTGEYRKQRHTTNQLLYLNDNKMIRQVKSN